MAAVASLLTFTSSPKCSAIGVDRSRLFQPRIVEERTTPLSTTPGEATPMPMTSPSDMPSIFSMSSMITSTETNEPVFRVTSA